MYKYCKADRPEQTSSRTCRGRLGLRDVIRGAGNREVRQKRHPVQKPNTLRVIEAFSCQRAKSLVRQHIMVLSWLFAGLATVVLPTACLLALALWYRERLEIWQSDSAAIRLTKPINQLSRLDLAVLIVGMLEKYAMHLIGLSTTTRSHGEGFFLPKLELHGTLDLSLDDVAKFRVAVPDDSDSSGAMLLTAFVAPAIPCLLSHHACSVKPLGVVNTRNTLASYSGITNDIEQLLNTQLCFRATVGGHDLLGTRHRRGMLFTVVVDVLAVEPSGASKKIMSQQLEYLQFLARSERPQYVESEDKDAKSNRKVYDSACANASSSLVALLHLKPRDTLQWASCNRDYNPIHLSTATAKAFGQKSVVSHGTYVVARALVGTKLPSNGMWKLEMRFLRPVHLPLSGQVRRCQCDQDDATTTFGVVDDRRSCLTWIVCSRNDM